MATFVPSSKLLLTVTGLTLVAGIGGGLATYSVLSAPKSGHNADNKPRQPSQLAATVSAIPQASTEAQVTAPNTTPHPSTLPSSQARQVQGVVSQQGANLTSSPNVVATPLTTPKPTATIAAVYPTTVDCSNSQINSCTGGNPVAPKFVGKVIDFYTWQQAPGFWFARVTIGLSEPPNGGEGIVVYDEKGVWVKGGQDCSGSGGGWRCTTSTQVDSHAGTAAPKFYAKYVSKSGQAITLGDAP